MGLLLKTGEVSQSYNTESGTGTLAACMLLLIHKALYGSGPQYLSKHLSHYDTTWTLRSSSKALLQVPLTSFGWSSLAVECWPQRGPLGAIMNVFHVLGLNISLRPDIWQIMTSWLMAYLMESFCCWRFLSFFPALRNGFLDICCFWFCVIPVGLLTFCRKWLTS